MKRDTVHNPDVLSCLANLSNDEVFTPPEVVNDMLDLLPPKLFRSPDTKFLDPCTKSGVFLREIAKRLIAGLADEIPDLQERIDHIMHHQLYGVAITEMTALLSRRSLYCSKDAQGKFAVSAFDTREGNIRFNPIQHTWKEGRCVYCGASRSQFDRDESLESHAYEFIHIFNPKDLFNMKFDVIIGNPPYQLADGGNGVSARPIYQLFVQQAQKLNPHYLTMIIPARWYAGGKGLDGFRGDMLADRRICNLVDYPNSLDCFSGVDIAGGICYFLWNRDYNGDCDYLCWFNGKVEKLRRKLGEHAVFVRYPCAATIIKKVMEVGEDKMDNCVSSRKPFGLATNAKVYKDGDIALRYNGGMAKYKRSEIMVGKSHIDKWKVIISYLSAEHAGQPDKNGMYRVLSCIEVLPPKTVCTETYLLTGSFTSKRMAENLSTYLKTKFVRFLVGQIALSQHITRGCFAFVPIQDFSKPWTDEELYKKYNLTQEEINFIESMIKPME